MPVPQEVDDLDRLIVRLDEDVRRRRNKVDQLRRDILEARAYVDRCRESKKLCLKNLKRMKKLPIVPIDEFRDMRKLYEDNCDLFIQHQNFAAAKTIELNTMVDAIPLFEAKLNEAKKARAQWGVVIPFELCQKK